MNCLRWYLCIDSPIYGTHQLFKFTNCYLLWVAVINAVGIDQGVYCINLSSVWPHQWELQLEGSVWLELHSLIQNLSSTPVLWLLYTPYSPFHTFFFKLCFYSTAWSLQWFCSFLFLLIAKVGRCGFVVWKHYYVAVLYIIQKCLIFRKHPMFRPTTLFKKSWILPIYPLCTLRICLLARDEFYTRHESSHSPPDPTRRYASSSSVLTRVR